MPVGCFRGLFQAGGVQTSIPPVDRRYTVFAGTTERPFRWRTAATIWEGGIQVRHIMVTLLMIVCLGALAGQGAIAASAAEASKVVVWCDGAFTLFAGGRQVAEGSAPGTAHVLDVELHAGDVIGVRWKPTGGVCGGSPASA